MTRNHEPPCRAFVPDLPDHRDDEYHGGAVTGLAVGLCVVAAVIVWWLL